MAERFHPLRTVSPAASRPPSEVRVQPLITVEVHVRVEGLAVARKLSPTDQPVELSPTNTRWMEARLIEVAEPDVAVVTDEAVNWWVLVFNVPPSA